MNETTQPVPQPIAQPVNQAPHIDLPIWEQLPAQCQRELVLTLASLLIALPEVSHEPIA